MFSVKKHQDFQSPFRRLWPVEGVLLAILMGFFCFLPRLDASVLSSGDEFARAFVCEHNTKAPLADCAVRFNALEFLGHIVCASGRNRSNVNTFQFLPNHYAVADSAEEFLVAATLVKDSFTVYLSPGWNDLHFILPKRAGPQVN